MQLFSIIVVLAIWLIAVTLGALGIMIVLTVLHAFVPAIPALGFAICFAISFILGLFR